MRENIEAITKNLRLYEKNDILPTLVAVTKTIPAERINTLLEYGITIIGENRAQELLDKLPYLDKQFSIHMIGQLQTNKVKYIISHVDMVQSVDRISLAREIDHRARQAGKQMDVLLQVNIGREPQKGGALPEEIPSLARACAALPGINIRGLMAVPPYAEDPEESRPYHKAMHTLFMQMKESIPGVSMEILSCGMSDDYVVALSEGANMVRIGSAIFGKRPLP